MTRSSNHKVRRLAGLLVLLFFAAAHAGCGPTVKCDKLHTQMMKCAQDLVLKLRPDNKKKLDKASDAEAKAEIQKAIDTNVVKVRKLLTSQVTKQCKKHDGRAKDAGQINKCVGASSCADFAACFAVYLKEKRK